MNITMNITKILAIFVIVLGVVGVAIGGVFVGQGLVKDNLLKTAMQQEQITLGLSADQIAAGDVVDTAQEAQAVADKVRADRHKIAATYEDLLGGKQFDPTDPKQLSYAQALNLENYLYLAVLGFGVTQIAMGAGAAMIIMGLALVATGTVLVRLKS